MDCKELLDSLEIIEKEKGIPKETIFEAIETSLVTACMVLLRISRLI